ncbi:YdiU family protein [Candidatus Marinamargulisbacteria bacterium SCGC AG-410-N11]|nr:YdiU family protein [Candidatus Marinamargulisbacteria bacterium SCGC AG-410-N11]
MIKNIFKTPTSYTTLPSSFYQQVNPIPVKTPQLICLNNSLAEQLQLHDYIKNPSKATELFSGNAIPDNTQPIALAYAGHQFGQFVPQLGDGRAVLLGECIDKRNQRWDVQLKGSGRTKFSRNGDGRCPLGPAIREYLVSEAMHALGVPTTRTLALVSTGEIVQREQAYPGGIVTRVASSHLRIGTFEYASAHLGKDAVIALTNYAISRHYPDCQQDTHPIRSFFKQLCLQQAKLIAKWLSLGFVHGVMNTDNTSISGETIDFGPCAFMESYNPDTVFSSIDRMGRYAYSQQPVIGQWNLGRLATCLLPLISDDQNEAMAILQSQLDDFLTIFRHNYHQQMIAKIGFVQESKTTLDLVKEYLHLMDINEADFTLSFRYLANVIESDQTEHLNLFNKKPGIQDWLKKWRQIITKEKQNINNLKQDLNHVNPAIIPRNHRIATIIDKAVEQQDYQPFLMFMEALKTPYSIQKKDLKYMEPAIQSELVTTTFCGT